MTSLPDRDLDHVLNRASGVWESLRGASIFITGGTGFVGRWLVESLLWANERLDLNISLFLLSRDPSRFLSECPPLSGQKAATLIGGDVRTFDFPAGDFPFVIHAATEPFVERSFTNPTGNFELNIAGTRRVLEFARNHGTRRFLFTSSGAVYGKQPPDMTHIPEEYEGAPSTTDVTSVYAQAKRFSEFLLSMYAEQYGFDALIARLFAFSGPLLPLRANFAVGNFLADLIAKEPIRVNGDGTPSRSYLYAADMALWLLTILARGQNARPYNVGSDEAITIADLALKVAALSSPPAPVEIQIQPIPGVTPTRYIPCVDRIWRELGLRQAITLEDGLHRNIEWLHENPQYS